MKNIIIIEKLNLFSKFKIYLLNKNKYKFSIFHPYQIDENEILFSLDKFDTIKINHSEEQEITYKANQIALDYLEKLNTDKIINFLNKLGYPKELVYAYKKYYFWKLTKKIRLSIFCKHIQNNNKKYSVKLLGKNSFFLRNYSITKNTEISPSKNNITFRRILKSISIIIFCLPLWVIKDLLENGFSFKKIKTTEFKTGQHMCNNFYKREDYEHYEFGKSRNDIFLHKQLNFELNKSAFVMSSWKFNKEDMQKNIHTIIKNEGKLVEEFKLKSNFSLLNLYFWKYLKSLKLIKSLSVFNYEELQVYSLIQMIRDIFIIEKFCMYYKIQRFYSRDDFNPLHIVRTVIFNKYKLKNYGVSHSIFLEPNTTLRGPYTFFNTYHTQGKIYYEMFKDTWKSNEHINSGPIYGVLVDEAMKNHEKKLLFNKKYNQKIKYLLLVSNYDSNSNPFDSWKINSERIINLAKILNIDDDSVLFIVPRNKNTIKKYLIHIDKDRKFQKKIIMDNSFSTYELLAYCNVLITEASSSSLFEATINPNISIIPFNVRGINNLPFKRDKNIRVFHTSEEIYAFLSSIKKNNIDLSTLKFNNNYIKSLLSNKS